MQCSDEAIITYPLRRKAYRLREWARQSQVLGTLAVLALTAFVLIRGGRDTYLSFKDVRAMVVGEARRLPFEKVGSDAGKLRLRQRQERLRKEDNRQLRRRHREERLALEQRRQLRLEEREERLALLQARELRLQERERRLKALGLADMKEEERDRILQQMKRERRERLLREEGVIRRLQAEGVPIENIERHLEAELLPMEWDVSIY